MKITANRRSSNSPISKKSTIGWRFWWIRETKTFVGKWRYPRKSENRKVVLSETSNAGYVYYHWTLEGEWVTNAANAGKALNVYVWDRNGTDSDGYTYTRFNAFEVGSILNPAYGTNTSGNNLDLTGEGIYSTCYLDTYNLAEYVSHWWYIVGIKQQQYIEYELFYVFTRDNESTEEVQAENENYNVTHWVKYEFK